jgi:hypothetical protein
VNLTIVNPPEVVVVAELQPLITAFAGGAMLRSPNAKTPDTTIDVVRFDLARNARRSERRSRMIARLLPRCLNTKALFNA